MNKDIAHEYHKKGFAVIPVKRNKRPYISWQEYQNRMPTEKEIDYWWDRWPSANIAVITGKISNLCTVDVDSEEGLKALNELCPDLEPNVKSPSGYHFHFAYEEGLGNSIRFLHDCDFKGDGGYVLVPPSVNMRRKKYESLKKVDRSAQLPGALKALLSSNAYNNKGSTQYLINNSNCNAKTSDTGAGDALLFSKGTRDEAIFHLAIHLVKSGMLEANIRKYVHIVAQSCSPPFTQKETEEKIQSAFKRKKSFEKSLAQEVREWVLSTNGYFFSTEIYRDLQLSTSKERKNVSIILKRLVNENIIERSGRRNGQFRKIETEIERIDFKNVNTGSVDIWLPFRLNEMVEISPGNIIVFAGAPNAGKTAFMLNIIRENMRDWDVHYFNSEMGGSELNKRIMKFNDLTPDMWDMNVYGYSDDYADHIKPGKNNLNIIDYMELHNDFYLISRMLYKIHKKLDGAICICCLQKNPGSDTGLGGTRSLEKPRLYLSLDANKLKIIKAKNFKNNDNPNKKETRFKIVQGCQLIQQGGWHYEAKKESQ